MAGFEIDIINIIVDNLRDRYKSGFPVLKEIIQNADDAASQKNRDVQLDFGLTEGLPGATHPLLKGPALFFLNNGSFTEQDARAVKSFALNSKAADSGAIGKFGLGMKSVFHFCEAFFWLAQDGEFKWEEIQNPWSGNIDYPAPQTIWDRFSGEDADGIRAHLKDVFESVCKQYSSYFLLWIPLRQKRHLIVNGEEVGSIISEFPGDNRKQIDFLFQPDLPAALAELLPLLRHLTSINFWNTNKGNSLHLEYNVQLRDGAKRNSYPRTINLQPLSGIVSYKNQTSDSPQQSIQFAGFEGRAAEIKLKELRDSAYWPKSYVRDNLGRVQPEPDKAKGHCAVTFSKTTKKAKGNLTIQWAVFLPLESSREECTCKSEFSYSLTLHGFFFVDAGRIAIEGLGKKASEINFPPQSQNELRRAWNYFLLTRGTFLLLIPALNQFVKQARVSLDETIFLCEAIRGSSLFISNRHSICQVSQWVLQVVNDGPQWVRVDVKQKILPIPAPPQKTPNRPWEVFPKLVDLEDEFIFVQKNAPHLTHLPIPQWNESALQVVLAINPRSLFTNQSSVNYLNTFLNDDSIKPFLSISTLQHLLKELIRKGFKELGSQMSSVTAGIQEIVSHVLPEQKYILSSEAPEVIRKLQSAEFGYLILHKNFDNKDNPGNAKLSVDAALEILTNLDHQLRIYEVEGVEISATKCRDIILEVLKNLDRNTRREVLQKGKDLKIITGYNCKLGRHSAFTTKELRDCQRNSCLFLYTQGINLQERLGLSVSLQSVLAVETIVLITSEIATIVFDTAEHGLYQCLAEGCLTALGINCKELKEKVDRGEIIGAVSGVDLHRVGTELIRGFRYLLHGDKDHFHGHATLWVQRYKQNPVWSKLWKQLASSEEDNILVQRNLAEKIPQDNRWQILGLREIDQQGILEDIRVKGTEFIEPSSFSVDERTEVLLSAQYDSDLWKILPLHETVQGTFVSITDLAYIETGFLIPEKISKHLHIIKLSSDIHLKRLQREYVNQLTNSVLIQNILSFPKSYNYFQFILDALARLGKQSDPALTKKLREIKWFIDKNNNPLSPADIVDLPEFTNEVSLLLAQVPGAFCQPEDLSPLVLEHPFVKSREMNCYYSSGVEGLDILEIIVSEAKDNFIGEIDFISYDLEKLLISFKDIPNGLRLDGWGFLAKVAKVFGIEDCKDRFLPIISKSIDSEKIISVLVWLANKHENGTENLDCVLYAFDCYLEVFSKNPSCHSFLSKLKLLNRNDVWCAADELCVEVAEIENSRVLNDRHYGILQSILRAGGKTTIKAETVSDDTRLGRRQNMRSQDAASILRLYFQDWENLVNQEIIAAFLHLMGADSEVKKLADSYSGTRSREWFIDKIFSDTSKIFKTYQGTIVDGAMEVCLTTIPDEYRFILEVVKDQTISLKSITGKKIQVLLTKDFQEIVIGRTRKILSPKDGFTFVTIQLRGIDTNSFSEHRLAKMLKNTILHLLNEIYVNNGAGVNDLWGQINESEQIDIQVAKSLVMDNLPLYLDQIGVRKNESKLGRAYNEWDKARYRVKELAVHKKNNEKDAEKLRHSLEEMQSLIIEDEAVQSATLAAIKRKISDYQYTPSSVPFELFQNADDAVVELAEIREYNKTEDNDGVLPSQVSKFIMCKNNDNLRFLHWGRPINHMGTAGFPGREKGYHQDLEKMIILSSSNKNNQQSKTGKFGLGFKSTLLISNTPIIISGRLSVKIIAGLCPTMLEDSITQRNILKRFNNIRQLPGTLIELPLISEYGANELTNEFELFSGLLTIFSRKIKTLCVYNDESEEITHSWCPSQFLRSENSVIEIGGFSFEKKKVNAIYFRSFKKGGVLVANGPRGFERLPEKVPPLWVLAPTQEDGDVFFAINGQFSIDPGRARLAGKKSQNIKIAHDLGVDLAIMLCGLFEESKAEWSRVKNKFNFEKTLTIYQFWKSVWETFTAKWIDQPENEVTQLTKSLLTGQVGIARLISQYSALPNGLWGEKFERLISPKAIRYVLRDSLSSEVVFRSLSTWNFFSTYIQPNLVISTEVFHALGKILPGFAQKKDQWQSLRLSDVLQMLGKSSYQLNAEGANALGKVITKEFLADLTRTVEGSLELEGIAEELEKIRFQTQDKGWHESAKILRGSQLGLADDELLRAGFAPKKNILHSSYKGLAIDFFITCRGEMSAKTDTLAKWVLDSDTSIQKSAALWYLVKGELGDTVTYKLRYMGTKDTWLSSLRYDCELFEGWDDEDIKELLFRKLPSLSDLERGGGEDDYNKKTTVISPVDVPKALENIYKWWSENRSDYLDKYELSTYPDNYAINSLSDDDRSAWLTMLMLGSFHTFGRAKPEQHRNFLALCNRKGWWEIFSRRNPKSHSDDWMGILEDFIDDQSEDSRFEYWMRLFPTIYKFSREVEEYVELFYSLETQGENLDVKQTMAPKTFSEFQGGGITAAPIARTLGMGVTFILREMMRKGLFKKNSENISPYCYVPLGRVRNLFSKMGCRDLENGESHLVKSEIIYGFLCEHIGSERADFAKSFDIPFQFIAEDLELQEQLFM